jgi:ABC-type Fe3+ transport system permease subunit
METIAAQRSVLLAMSASVSIAYLVRLSATPTDAIKNPGSMLRISMGGAVAAIGLMLLANPQPELAKLLAWLIAFGTIMTYGEPLFVFVNRVLTQNYKIELASKASKKVPSTPLAEKESSPKKGN